MASENSDIVNQISDHTNIVIENENQKVKYKKPRKPYVNTPARLEAQKRMQEGLAKSRESKKLKTERTAEELQKQIEDLKKEISKVREGEKHDDEIKITRPVKIEKEHKKDQSYEEFKHEMSRMREIIEKLTPAERQEQQQQIQQQLRQPVGVPPREMFGIKF